MTRIGVLASGNGSNLQALIDAELSPGALTVVIVNNPDARSRDRAERAGIETLLINHRDFEKRADFDRALVEALSSRKVDWVVLAGFMRVLGAPMLEAFQRRIVNIHPALLPSFPGLHAQAQALAARVKITGCTVHLVDAGVDTGPILAQVAVPVLPADDESSLSQRILREEHRVFPATVRALAEGRLIERTDGRVEIEGGLMLPADDERRLTSPRGPEK